MSTLCKGKVEQHGQHWLCLDCGYESSAWNTQHEPLQTRAAHFLACFEELVVASKQTSSVGAAKAA